eukprot:TRINITY_DN93800_c0_g1_i1.p1 TRINITY_DN93800_c0_g1~~TRINITY_DN93800_c0_g1_i1.p1  ORF type:complete len:109 (+),score=5.23 TRINITY_DN93800_c0_g1_i1:33-359(+)
MWTWQGSLSGTWWHGIWRTGFHSLGRFGSLADALRSGAPGRVLRRGALHGLGRLAASAQLSPADSKVVGCAALGLSNPEGSLQADASWLLDTGTWDGLSQVFYGGRGG